MIKNILIIICLTIASFISCNENDDPVESFNYLELVNKKEKINSTSRSTSNNVTWVDLDFEDVTRFSKYYPVSWSSSRYQSFVKDALGNDFLLFHHSEGKTPWLTGGEHRAGLKSLGTQIFPDIDDYKERSEIVTSLGDESYALKFGRLRYWSQSVLIQNDTDSDTESFVLMQVHQSGGGKYVPFVIWMKMENGRGLIKGSLAHPDTLASGTHTLFGWTDVGPKDQWFDLALKIAPRHEDHLGDIQVRLNGQEIGSARRYWGYPFGDDYWRLSSGIYKAPGNTNNIVICLDEIKLGSSWESIQPDN